MARNLIDIARKVDEDATTITIFGEVYPTVRLTVLPTVPQAQVLAERAKIMGYQAKRDSIMQRVTFNAATLVANDPNAGTDAAIDIDAATAAASAAALDDVSIMGELAMILEKILEANRATIYALVPTLPRGVLNELDEDQLSGVMDALFLKKRAITNGSTPTESQSATEPTEKTPTPIAVAQKHQTSTRSSVKSSKNTTARTG